MSRAVMAVEEDPQTRPRTSRLQADLAARILRMLKEQGAGAGHHLVEADLCREFEVSRTPVRGALRLLAEQGAVEARANRGFVLRKPVLDAPDADPIDPETEEDRRVFIAIAEARNQGRLPDQCSQQEMVRVLGVKRDTVIRVLRQMSEMGFVERKAGNGWSFTTAINSERARQDSYAFRAIVEPAGLIEPTFELDTDWMERSRARHLAFRKRRWRNTLALEFYEMNADFHEQLARCSGNQYILSAIQRQNKLRTFLNIDWVDGVEQVLVSIDEHMAVLDALAAADNAEASRLMRAHLDHTRALPSPITTP